MPLYYFNVEDGRTILDEVGTDLPSLAAARDAAIVTSGEILKNGGGRAMWSGSPWRLWVTDEPRGSGKTLFTLEFSAKEGEGTAF